MTGLYSIDQEKAISFLVFFFFFLIKVRYETLPGRVSQAPESQHRFFLNTDFLLASAFKGARSLGEGQEQEGGCSGLCRENGGAGLVTQQRRLGIQEMNHQE